MSVTGLCQICESREAEHSCPNCGNQVCERHWNDGMDLCVQCAPTGENVDPDRVSPEDLDDDDVMTF
ncbi:hypothetical protein NGM10_13020 [Halorussus salilacus]|uniref:hypothetical protein n=1 Tax=Halorussus salilacus TaxID=2953750 RepID=UPI00209FCAD3|nr:hypothetical protein [Halorussus salilacus]USZ67645.1 hypothetical protein NGM10_13020 [Halorussus salilacus]